MSLSTRSQLSSVSDIREELDYEKRVNQLEQLGKTIEIDNTESIASYYRGSYGMIKKADLQYSDNQLENAFISYLKFLDLFRRKIAQHVDYKRVPLSAKSTNQFYQRHAQLRVKELRKRLLQHYKEMSSLHDKQEEPMAFKKLCKRDRTVSTIHVFRSTTTSHTDAIDRRAFDLEACRSLRTVVVPKQLPTIYQIVTQKMKACYNVWATLAGQLINNEYVITHLIIPKQENMDAADFTKNPCEPYANKNNLEILGWIHTHRPASCYMSVTDLHAQWDYQSRLPEAIGIVCAPRFTQVEIYMLTNHGMEFIAQCSKRNIHSHKISRPLYTIARHVKVVYDVQFELVYLSDEGDDDSGINPSSQTW